MNRPNPAFAACCLRTLGAGALILCLLTALPSAASGDAIEVHSIAVDDPRPLAAAADEIEHRFGAVVTYEDPPFVHPSAVVDVTARVAGEPDRRARDRRRPILIPRGGRLEVTYLTTPESGLLIEPAALTQELVDEHRARALAGRFRVEQRGERIHLVPTAVRNQLGSWQPHRSILDARIQLPAGERSGLETLQAIVDAVSGAAGVPVWIGMVPANPLVRHRGRESAVDRAARDVLADLLDGVADGASWRLFYDPGLELYVLNVHLVRPSGGAPGGR